MDLAGITVIKSRPVMTDSLHGQISKLSEPEIYNE